MKLTKKRIDSLIDGVCTVHNECPEDFEFYSIEGAYIKSGVAYSVNSLLEAYAVADFYKKNSKVKTNIQLVDYNGPLHYIVVVNKIPKKYKEMFDHNAKIEGF